MTKRSKKKTNPLSVVKTWQVVSAILGILLAGIALKAVTISAAQNTVDVQELAKTSVDFINQNLLQGQTATLVSAEEVGGVVQINISISGQQYTSYVTMDGSKLFVSAINLKEAPTTAQTSNTQTSGVEKSDKPVVELFVMSYCPFGTQMEKGILPVVQTLGDKIDFQLKFVNYAMHGEKEVIENTYQYCIQKDFPDKFIDYMYCFLNTSKRDDCLTQVGIDTAKLQQCYGATDSEYNITGLYNDKSTWSGGRFPPYPIHNAENAQYGVRGSPTLVINGKQVSAARSPASLLATICSAFNNVPEECNTQLSSTTPSAGFGLDSTGQDTTASCG